jgi:catechol 2,3-dioxygenase-like lactoylglutathione lyase family enzyme
MNVSGLHHTGLIVKDLDRSIYFYHDLLGLPFAVEPTDRFSGEALDTGLRVPGAELRLCAFRVGEGHLELLQYRRLSADMDRPYPNNTLGAGHVCLQVDDVQAAKAELEAKGVEFYSDVNVVDEGPLAGWRWIYFADPDGLSLELVEIAYTDEAQRQANAQAYLRSRPALDALGAGR